MCANGYRESVAETTSFLIRAQWLLQESRADGIDGSKLNRLVSQQAAQAQKSTEAKTIGAAPADLAVQARLNAIAEALHSRHSDVSTSVTNAQVAGYYSAHRSHWANPAVLDSLMVVTHSLPPALKARAALAAGQRWVTVADRYSVDPSKLNGGVFAVVEGEQSRALEHAVLTARRGRIVGPVEAPPTAGPPMPTYYLFEVTGGHPGSARPLAQVATQVKQTLTEQLQQQSWASFSSAYKKRWTTRTLCAPGYLVPECRNDPTKP